MESLPDARIASLAFLLLAAASGAAGPLAELRLRGGRLDQDSSRASREMQHSWSSAETETEQDMQVIDFQDLQPMRAEYRVDANGLVEGAHEDRALGAQDSSSVGAGETQPAPPTQSQAKQQKGRGEHRAEDPVQEAEDGKLGSAHLSQSDAAKNASATQGRLGRDRRGQGSKLKHANSRARRIQQTGTLRKKPLGSRRQQQGATAAACREADDELLSLGDHLLKDTVSDLQNADMAPVLGRKWYNTSEGREFLASKRRLEEFSKQSKRNERFAREYGCLPDELKMINKLAREIQRKHLTGPHASEPWRDATPDLSYESDWQDGLEPKTINF